MSEALSDTHSTASIQSDSDTSGDNDITVSCRTPGAGQRK